MMLRIKGAADSVEVDKKSQKYIKIHVVDTKTFEWDVVAGSP